ncbi:MAG: AAA family ATPase, partial [Planctomycetaceae bacterium]|nr:AAA family ATPase [Planctomycetaceae bacterium]
MLIRCLNVAKYGVCRNTEIDDLNGDLVVVYGPNETGKTTCMEFIRGVFYGLANDGREKYVRGHTEDV